MTTEKRKPKTHELKCWPIFWRAIAAEEKTFELRRDDGRDFQVGDKLVLNEFQRGRGYTGHQAFCDVVYVMRAEADAWGLLGDPRAVIMGIKLIGTFGPVEPEEEQK